MDNGMTLAEVFCEVETTATTTLPADQHPAKVYLARLAPGSRRAMKDALNTVAGMLTSGRQDAEALDWTALRYQHTTAVRAKLATRYSPATCNKVLAALRGVLRECWRLGLMDAETYQRAVDLEPIRGTTLPSGRALASGEVKALFDACRWDLSPAGARDAALMAVLYGAGLRRSEVVALDMADYDPDTGALKVKGKGNKERIAYATNGAAAALAAWMKHRGEEPGPLFLPVNKGGKIALQRMTAQAVLNALAKRAKEAGVAHFSPHDLRRSFISDLLDAGADLATVKDLAGHANIGTTARYDRRGEVAKRKAATMLHVPFGSL